LPSARSTKFFTALGFCSGKSLAPIFPSDVTNVAYSSPGVPLPGLLFGAALPASFFAAFAGCGAGFPAPAAGTKGLRHDGYYRCGRADSSVDGCRAECRRDGGKDLGSGAA
jgi:hypothetical protein